MKAFPIPSYVNASGETHDVQHQGMDLRDYFAGLALQGLLVEFTNKQEVHDFMLSATLCYMVADAMMEARK